MKRSTKTFSSGSYDPDGVSYVSGPNKGQKGAFTLTRIDEQGQTQTRYYDASGNRNTSTTRLVQGEYFSDGDMRTYADLMSFGGSSYAEDRVPDIVRDFPRTDEARNDLQWRVVA